MVHVGVQDISNLPIPIILQSMNFACLSLILKLILRYYDTFEKHWGGASKEIQWNLVITRSDITKSSFMR